MSWKMTKDKNETSREVQLLVGEPPKPLRKTKFLIDLICTAIILYIPVTFIFTLIFSAFDLSWINSLRGTWFFSYDTADMVFFPSP